MQVQSQSQVNGVVLPGIDDDVSRKIVEINSKLERPGIDSTLHYILETEKSELDRRKTPRGRCGSLAEVR